MDLLQGIRTFVRVVEHGSFTQAAQALGTSPATVSRQVAGLEQALSARLLQRTTSIASRSCVRSPPPPRTSKTASPTPVVACASTR